MKCNIFDTNSNNFYTVCITDGVALQYQKFTEANP